MKCPYCAGEYNSAGQCGCRHLSELPPCDDAPSEGWVMSVGNPYDLVLSRIATALERIADMLERQEKMRR